MRARSGWLFPLMVIAAGSVTVFGCIGIAAITGYLPPAKANATAFAEPLLHTGGVVSRTSGIPTTQSPTVAIATTGAQTDAAHAGAGQPKNAAGTAQKKPSPE